MYPDPLPSDAGAWTEDEAYCVYHRKLVRLRDLYVGQLSHLRHMLQEKRRHFLLQWHAEGGGRGQGMYMCVHKVLFPIVMHKWLHKASLVPTLPPLPPLSPILP